ncbi:FHA domain-containing protein [Thauera sp. CAU 1555]|uniref:FHA domain-containing protein n=1 Tax=Thauera sedimentorum TaxID=2767595 RepID=A0ABR9BDS0_9RHOO|nr:FHA domain-containing protein [Thauera sedimentorum]MBC9073593.1 FHA domain-containing protein [Thauera sedimentorum]MBD8504512.1 FHA domain-containing protein [Thauera sedimentorum]
MPKLILSMDGLVLKEVILKKERTTIGRKADNDIQIDNLAISGHHAVIVCILNDAFLEDLNSTNGTYVNSQQIKKHVLKNHDVIELGKYRLKFLVDAAPSGAGAVDLVDTGALRAAGAPEVEALAASSPERSQTRTQHFPPESLDAMETPSALPEGALQVLSGANAGRELALTKSLTTLGKPGNQVAVITRRPHGYYITHVEGASFPMVNGQTLDAQAHRLEDHDIIEIAGIKMEFFLRA